LVWQAADAHRNSRKSTYGWCASAKLDAQIIELTGKTPNIFADGRAAQASTSLSLLDPREKSQRCRAQTMTQVQFVLILSQLAMVVA